ncbi:uncharacterized protein si:zfos-911d5.4 isoform X1 [Xyrauchen texanus]|uniref:uncharacterized protein si:zfos-911d5.4 isoform X1 n=2 Tax=Xyrauchen texanus TaxID=154827 RepID=UPI0022423122|nr:uncharacterized protein si:zfos-911d5.4 isoform X1 [Xyrauchen texanus]
MLSCYCRSWRMFSQINEWFLCSVLICILWFLCFCDCCQFQMSRMFQMLQFLVPSEPNRSRNTCRSQATDSSQEFLKHIRTIIGLREDDMFHNLRIPNQLQTDRDEINLVIITGHGVFCVDVKSWSACVSVQDETHWLLQVKSEQQNITNICVEQVPDALKNITMKTRNLCSHMTRCGLNIRPDLFYPRILFQSSDCVLSDDLRNRSELVSHTDLHMFLRSITETHVSWISHLFIPSWISGHLSYSQMRAIRERLRLMKTWDLLQMCNGTQLKGDYQTCKHLNINRHDTEQLNFSRGRTSTDILWRLLGHTPQVTVRMYKRGAPGWLGKPLIATATIPSSSHAMFRIRGEETDTEIPAHDIQSITLSI